MAMQWQLNKHQQLLQFHNSSTPWPCSSQTSEHLSSQRHVLEAVQRLSRQFCNQTCHPEHTAELRNKRQDYERARAASQVCGYMWMGNWRTVFVENSPARYMFFISF